MSWSISRSGTNPAEVAAQVREDLESSKATSAPEQVEVLSKIQDLVDAFAQHCGTSLSVSSYGHIPGPSSQILSISGS